MKFNFFADCRVETVKTVTHRMLLSYDNSNENNVHSDITTSSKWQACLFVKTCLVRKSGTCIYSV